MIRISKIALSFISVFVALVALVSFGYTFEETNSRMLSHSDLHEFLFDDYVKGKECVYSADKEKLVEVFIDDQQLSGMKSLKIQLPRDTEQVVGLFDQLVIYGNDLAKAKVSIGLCGKSVDLKSIALTDEQLVLKSFRVSIAELAEVQDLKKSGVIERLVLDINSPIDFSIEKVSLRSTKNLFVDYKKLREEIFQFGKDMRGQLLEKLYRLTVDLSVDELSKSLSESSEAFERIVYTRTMSSAKSGTHPLRGIVNDPRVAKIYESLLAMGEDASPIASAMYNRAFLDFQNSWQDAGVLPNSEIYSCHAHLFLCSEFCSAEEVIQKMDAWDSWHAERAIDPSQFQFRFTAGLEQSFSMNLQMNLVARKHGFGIQELNDWVAATLGPSLLAPPSTDPKHGLGGNKPPSLHLIDMHSSDSATPAGSTLLTRIPDIEFLSSIDNPIRKEALQNIIRDELLGDKRP